MNLCTDQLLLAVGAPAQILSLSHLAQDPHSSPAYEAAALYPSNHAQAEELYRLAPDLILASAYSPPATLALLRALGLRVETFESEQSFADIRHNLTRMGEILERPEAAAAQIAAFDAALRAPAAKASAPRRIAAYGPNGFATTGGLWREMLQAAGHKDAYEGALRFSATLPLEDLLTLAPDLLVLPRPFAGASRAEELLLHPALRDFSRLTLAHDSWSCSAKAVAEAVQTLREALP